MLRPKRLILLLLLVLIACESAEPTPAPDIAPTETQVTLIAPALPTRSPTASPPPTATPIPPIPPIPTETVRPTETPLPTATPQLRTHVIQPGETLINILAVYFPEQEIANRVDEVVALNNLESANAIFAGQALLIPGEPRFSGSIHEHILQPFESLWHLSIFYNVPLACIERMRDQTRGVQPGDAIKIPDVAYEVQPSDAGGLALMTGPCEVSIAALRAANDDDLNRVQPGNIIAMPSGYSGNLDCQPVLDQHTENSVWTYTHAEGNRLICLTQDNPALTLATVYNNNINRPGLTLHALKPGQTLLVPPSDGILYQIQAADEALGVSLFDIAITDYGSLDQVGLIQDWAGNTLIDQYNFNDVLPEGQTIFLPGAASPRSRFGLGNYQPINLLDQSPTPEAEPSNTATIPPSATPVVTRPPNWPTTTPWPTPTPWPTVFPTATPDRLPPGAQPYFTQLWAAAIPEYDTGYCQPLDGFGWTNSIIWPTNPHPITTGRGFGQLHTGIDIGVPIGTPVIAAESGVVIWAGFSTTALGNTVVLAHGNGWQTFYGHLNDVSNLQCGQTVSRGTLIGWTGMSGATTFPHLHFTVRKGNWAIDPLLYLP